MACHGDLELKDEGGIHSDDLLAQRVRACMGIVQNGYCSPSRLERKSTWWNEVWPNQGDEGTRGDGVGDGKGRFTGRLIK